MMERLARLFREESTAITVPVGFVVLYATWTLLASIIGGVFYPVLLRLLDKDPSGGDFDDARISFHIGNVLVDVTTLIIYGAAFVLLTLLIYLLITRWLVNGESFEMRECPECKSDIFADARRCAFCSAAVTPLVGLSGTVEETGGG